MYQEGDVPIVQPTNREMVDSVHNLKVLIGDIQGRFNEHIDKSKKVLTNRYNKYTTIGDVTEKQDLASSTENQRDKA